MISFSPTRMTQPYGGLNRQQSPQLAAMLAGRPLFAPNPQDHQRAMQRLAAMILGR